MAEDRLSAHIKRHTLEEFAAYHTPDGELIDVAVAARILRVTERRVRSFIFPECRCVERNRRKHKKGVPDADCPSCYGDGKGIARLRAVKLSSNYFVKYSDLLLFSDVPRISGSGNPPVENPYT
jgi:hypothetical protein